MAFTQNGKIKKAKDIATLQAIAENPEYDWTDERKGIFLDQADGIVNTNGVACLLATNCLDSELCNQLLSHFAKKIGIPDLDELNMYLSAFRNEQLALGLLKGIITDIISSVEKGTKPPDVELLRKKFNATKRAPLETQANIVAAAADVLTIPADADLDQIGRIATISGDLISYSKEQHLLEESIVDAALPLFKSVFDLSLFIDEHIRTNSCTCALVVGFAQEKLGYFPNAIILMGMVGGSTDTMPDEIADLVSSTRLAIYDAAADLLSKNGKEATLSQLQRFAGEIRDHKGDGSGSKLIEDAVIATALTKVTDANEAADMARAFNTRTGAHQMLLSYLNGLDGKPFVQDDLDTIAGAVKSMVLGGADVFVKLIELATEHGLEFDEKEAIAKMNIDGLPPILKAVLSGVLSPSAGGKMTFESLRKAKRGCNCPVCQIRALIEEDSDNISLVEEWEITKHKLVEDGVLKKHTENEYAVLGGQKGLEEALERHDVSKTMRQIILKAYGQDDQEMDLESFKKFMGDCPCPECQIKRLIKQDPENSFLLDEWETAKQSLVDADVLVVKGSRGYAIKGSLGKFFDTLDSLELSETLGEIMRKAFSKDNTSPLPGEIAALAAALGEMEQPIPFGDFPSSGFLSDILDKDDFPGSGIIVEVVPKTAGSPEELREELEKQLQAGTLANFKVMTGRGMMTVKEMAAVDPEEANPELFKVVQEYASMIE